MNFLGVVTNKDIQDINGDTVTLYNIVLTDGTTIQTTKFKNGDVIIQDETAKEFVFSVDRWVEFGDATGNAAAISGLDTRVTSLENYRMSNENWKTTILIPALNGHGTRITNLETAVASKAEQSTVHGIDGRVTDIEGVLGDISNGNEFHIIDSADNKMLTVNETGTSSTSFHAIYDEDSTAQDKGGNIIADKDVQSEAGSLNNTINLLGKSSKEAYNSTAFKDIESLETNVNNLGATMTTVKTNLGWSGDTVPKTVDERISTALGTAQGYANTAEGNAKAHTNESIEALINDAYYYKTTSHIGSHIIFIFAVCN